MAKKLTKKPQPKETKSVPAITYKRTQKEIAVKDIIINDQSRVHFDSDSIIELAGSIKSKGLLQSIGVHLVKGKYELIYGERRTRAIKLNKTDIIGAIVYENLTPDQVVELQITENLQRKDLHPMEEANAFKNLMTTGKKTIPEIALRLSRSEKYVGLRLKLNDLIPSFQKAFYSERMSMRDALEVCKLSIDAQKEIYESEASGKDPFTIDEYTLNEYRDDLKKAPFDLKDATLNKAAGACVSCPHNTAGNNLFPDESGKSICMNSKCFKGKCATSFQLKLKKAKEDPGTVLYTSNYYDGQFTKELKKSGELVYDKHGVNIISNPKAADIASGKVVKAFCVEGDGKGKEGFVSIIKKSDSNSDAPKGTAAAFKEKQSEGKTTNADILSEIQRMEEVEKRKHEIDDEKTWPLLYNLLYENNEFTGNENSLLLIEKIVFIIMLVSKIPYTFDFEADDYFQKKGFKGDMDSEEFIKWLMKNADKLDSFINIIARNFFYSNIQQMHGNDAPEMLGLMDINLHYDPAGHKKIVDEVESVRAARKEKLTAAIDKLKAQLKGKAK